MNSPPPNKRTLRILLVEDESLVAMTLEYMLEDLGHRIVGIASRIAMAMQVAETAEIDMAILDVNLDGQSSYPVAELLRSRGIPFVFMTGYGSEGVDASFKDTPVLAKPFTLADLTKFLERMAVRLECSHG